MSRNFSLAYLTYAPLNPPEVIRLAARCGYQAVGLRILPALPGGDCAPLLTSKAMLRETIAAMRDTSVIVYDMEIIRIGESFDATATIPFLEISAELGAKAVLVAGDDPEESRLTANYAAFCEAARPHGLTADLEFMPFSAVKNANQARRIVAAAGQPNGGVLVDALHFGRSETSLADLAALPRPMLHYVQLCDGEAGTHFTREQLIHTARIERLMPGEGTIDLKGMLKALPQDAPISLEIPNDALKREIGVEAFALRALECCKAVMVAGA
jgi:sugar phosphate isomerase/epimerase